MYAYISNYQTRSSLELLIQQCTGRDRMYNTRRTWLTSKEMKFSWSFLTSLHSSIMFSFFACHVPLTCLSNMRSLQKENVLLQSLHYLSLPHDSGRDFKSACKMILIPCILLHSSLYFQQLGNEVSTKVYNGFRNTIFRVYVRMFKGFRIHDVPKT